MPFFRFLLMWFILIALPTHSLFAQTAPAKGSSPVFTINARTVVEDVVVMDKDGRAVPNLREQDFQVFENGKPQAITFFDSDFAVTETATAPPAALPPNSFSNNPLAAPNHVTNVLLLDALNTWPEDRMYAQVQMVKYLASLPPNLRIGIFTLTDEKLNLIQGFNEDSSTLRKAVSKFTSNYSHSSSHSISGQKQALTTALDEAKQTADDTRLAESVNALQHFLRNGPGILDSHDQLVTTLNVLQALAHYLAGVPGRKNLFWLVGNFPICIPAKPFDCPYLDLYNETQDMLAEAGVSVYPIDAGGVGVDMGIGPSAFEHQPSTRIINSETWAEDTGGKAYHANDIKQEIAEAVDHGSRYYTLAYVPSDEKEDGRERKVEIRVVSADYKPFYRKRYREQTQNEIMKGDAASGKAPLISLMGHGLPNIAEIPYRLKVVASAVQPGPDAARAGQNAKLAGKLTRYHIGFQLQTGSFPLPPDADGARRVPLQVALMVYGQDFKPLNWEIRNIQLLIKPEQWASDQSVGIRFHMEIDAPPGDVYLRTGVYDASTGKVGTLDSRHNLPIAPNLLNRNFTVAAPNQAWVGDFTYIPTEEGWLFLAVVIDLFSRKVVGWSMRPDMQRDLVIDALEMAWFRRDPGKQAGLIFHSDRGSQYASDDFSEVLKAHGITPSMSRKGNCWDNACSETLFGSLKVERLHGQRFQTIREAKDETIAWLLWYNRTRMHSTLNYVSPMQFEQDWTDATTKIAA